MATIKATVIFAAIAALCVQTLGWSAPVHAAPATYYVDAAAGNDSNAGTSEGSAWATVQKAAATVGAGHKVLVKNGTYRETVTPASSGTATEPISYEAFPGHQPLVSAADTVTGWSSLGDAEAGGLFASGFESGTFADFNSTTINGSNSLIASSAAAQHGLYGAEATFSGAAGDDGARVNKNITASNDTHVRLYFKLSNNFDLNASAQRFDILFLKSGTSTNRVRASIVKDGSGNFSLQGRLETPAAVNFYSGTPGEIVKNTWYSVELRYKGNDAATGGAEVWLNGVSKGSTYTRNTSGLSVDRVEAGANTSSLTEPSAGSKLYVDDVKVNTASVGTFTAEGAAVIYKKTGVTWTPRQLFRNNVLMSSASNLGTMVADTYYFDDPNDVVYTRLAADANPNTSGNVMEISRRSSAFEIIGKSYITFKGVNVDKNNTSSIGAFNIVGSNNVGIFNTRASYNYGSGVKFSDNSDNNKVSYSIISDNDRDFGGGIRIEKNSDGNVIEHTEIYGSGGSGIQVRGVDSLDVEYPSNGTVIRFNRIHDLRDSAVYLTKHVDNSEVYGNTIYKIDISGPTSGGNGVHMGIDADNNLVYNNLIYSVQSHGVTMREGSDNNRVYNNSIYDVGRKGSGSSIDMHMTTALGSGGNIVKNNLLYKAGTACVFADAQSVSAGGNVMDYNLCYNPGARVAKWNDIDYTDFNTYRQASAQDAHSVYADPQFINPTSDFGLKATSPAIDAGIDTPAVSADIQGRSRNLIGKTARADGSLFDRFGGVVSGLLFSPVSAASSAPDIGAYEYDPGVLANTGSPFDPPVSSSIVVALLVGLALVWRRRIRRHHS